MRGEEGFREVIGPTDQLWQIERWKQDRNRLEERGSQASEPGSLSKSQIRVWWSLRSGFIRCGNYERENNRGRGPLFPESRSRYFSLNDFPRWMTLGYARSRRSAEVGSILSFCLSLSLSLGFFPRRRFSRSDVERILLTEANIRRRSLPICAPFPSTYAWPNGPQAAQPLSRACWPSTGCSGCRQSV